MEHRVFKRKCRINETTKVNRNNFDKAEFVCYKLVRLECEMDAFREEAATLASEMLRGLNRKCRN